MCSRRCDESTNFLSRPINYLYLCTIFSGTKNNGKNIRSRKYKKRFFASLTSCSHFHFRRRRKNQNKIDGNIQSRPKAGNEKRGIFSAGRIFDLGHFSTFHRETKTTFPYVIGKSRFHVRLSCQTSLAEFFFSIFCLSIPISFVVDPKSYIISKFKEFRSTTINTR